MKHLGYIFAFVLVINISDAQDQKKKTDEPADIARLIESQRFEFVAQSANPLRGRSIFLSPGYTFKVSPDTVESYLPYYGRAYQASLDPDDAGIKFTSTEFTYLVKGRKNQRWNISINPKDVKNSPQIILSVSSNGYTSVRITSIDRQSISFSGYIRKVSTE